MHTMYYALYAMYAMYAMYAIYAMYALYNQQIGTDPGTHCRDVRMYVRTYIRLASY